MDLTSGTTTGIPTGDVGALTAGDNGAVWVLQKDDRLVELANQASGKEGGIIHGTDVEVGENVHVEVQWGAGSVWVGSDGLPVVRLTGTDLDDATRSRSRPGSRSCSRAASSGAPAPRSCGPSTPTRTP